MLKADYFRKCLREQTWRFTDWNLSIFSVITRRRLNKDDEYSNMLFHDDKGYYFYSAEEENAIRIEDGKPNEPLFTFTESVTLNKQDLPHVFETVNTTYGRAIANAIVLAYAFKDKIPYWNKPFTISDIEKVIEQRVVDDLPTQQEMDSHTGPTAPLFISEFKEFNSAAGSLVAYSQIAIPSVTPKMLTTDPKVEVRKKELLEQYKDQLDDPVIQAKIGAELVQIDKDWIKGDDGELFYFESKYYDVIRKKRFVLHGTEDGFGIKGRLITSTLEQGWDAKDLPEISNGLRDGSYSRGAQTALGGEATKFNYRMYQNTKITETDCGSTLGLLVHFTPTNTKYYVGSSYFQGNKLIQITPENHSTLANQALRIRSPIYCKTEGVNFCATCIGHNIAQTPNAIATYAADVSSAFMGAAMKAMHGKALKTAHYSFKDRLW